MSALTSEARRLREDCSDVVFPIKYSEIGACNAVEVALPFVLFAANNILALCEENERLERELSKSEQDLTLTRSNRQHSDESWRQKNSQLEARIRELEKEKRER